MDGILVQDSDWSRKLSLSLYDLLKKKLLCDLGIVCSSQNDVTSIKSNEVVMVHRCVLSAASETIKHLSVRGQIYNLVKINGVNISIQCWSDILQFVYCGHTTVNGSRLCELKKASQVLQIKPMEIAVDELHSSRPCCNNLNKDLSKCPISLSNETSFTVNSDRWVSELFEAMLDLLVKQTLCNMTIITEKSDKTSSEILAHLCMLVAASTTIRELVLQGSDTYNSVKIDSISYNTWLYLLEYIYTSRVSIVKSNIPEVWVASQLLQIEGLANAVSSFATQVAANRKLSHPTPAAAFKILQKSQQIQPASNEQTFSQISDSTVESSHDFLGLKSETSSACGDMEAESHVSGLCDETTFDLLNNDSCDAQSTTNPLEKLDLHTNVPLPGVDTPVDKSPKQISEASSSNCSLQISNLLQNTTSSFALGTSALLTAPINSNPQLLQNAQFVPVQTVSGGALIQSSALGAGQWIQTLGMDGVTPVRLWLPQCAIPVVTQMKVSDIPADATTAVNESQLVASVSTVTDSTQQIAADDNTNTDPLKPEPTPGKNYLFFCRSCEQLFSEQSSLNEHTCSRVVQSEAVSSTGLTTNGTAASKLQCKFCLKIFSRTWTLNVHMRTHTGERPYKCTVCDKAFSDKSNMRQHTLIHTENKQFKCPSCHQTFAQKRYMKKHFLETCRRKGPEPEAAVVKVNSESMNPADISTDTKTSQQRKPQKSFVIYVPRSNVPLSSKAIKTEPVEDEAEESSRWDTSIFLAGDKVAVDDDDDRPEEQKQSVCESDPFSCDTCKRKFKNERQFKSHKCQYI